MCSFTQCHPRYESLLVSLLTLPPRFHFHWQSEWLRAICSCVIDFHLTLLFQVSWEISFQIHFENSLTEPHVARVVSESLQSEDTLFLGNSMVIRDADMYGRGWANSTTNIAPFLSNRELPCQGIRVSGNRGASGIDGLLSTAIGYAVGCNKRVSISDMFACIK